MAGIDAGTSVQAVVAQPAGQEIVAGPAEELVRCGVVSGPCRRCALLAGRTGVQVVVTGSSVEVVAVREAGDDVGARPPYSRSQPSRPNTVSAPDPRCTSSAS